VDHVVYFHAVHKRGIVSHFGLNAVELAVELLKVGESSKVDLLDIVPDMLVREKVFYYLVALAELSEICSRLLKPFFQETRAYLRFALVQHTVKTSGLA